MPIISAPRVGSPVIWLALFLSALVLARADNLVIDGSFENHPFENGMAPSGVAGWKNLNPPYAPSLVNPVISYPGSVPPVIPPEGQYFMAIFNSAPAGFYQQIDGLEVGKSYHLSFWLGEGRSVDPTQEYRFEYGSTVRLVMDGATSFDGLIATPYTTGVLDSDPGPYTRWDLETLDFVAGSTGLTLSFLMPGTPDDWQIMSHWYPAIDDVRLEGIVPTSTVPETTPTLALFGGALGLLGLVRSRDRLRMFSAAARLG
ncbi:MAG TPA: hypothetical protein VFJ90_05710 [Candidatus Didemnitutus sp.]|nr:hypothetical protein [Candidatus Didemnitutus sp.]